MFVCIFYVVWIWFWILYRIVYTAVVTNPPHLFSLILALMLRSDYFFVCSHHFQQTGRQPGMVAYPARVLVRAWELVSRIRFGCHVPRQPAHSSHPGWIWCLRTGLYSPFPLQFPLELSCAIGLVSSLSGQAIALPMAFTTENRHKAVVLKVARLT